MFTYTCLLLLAVYLNRNCSSSVLLTLIVGLGYYSPTEMIHSKVVWFSTCITIEILIAISALSSQAASRYAITGISFMLALSHILCWEFRTLYIYHFIANYLEYLQIITCSIFSAPVINTIKERVERCLPQKF